MNRPAISVVQALPGYDRDMLLRDALSIAGARAHRRLPTDVWTVQAEPTLNGVTRAVQRMLAVPKGVIPAPQVLVVPGLMDRPDEERRACLSRLHDLDEASAPCHVLTTQDPSVASNLEWSGRLLRVEVNLMDRPELTALRLARESLLPGRTAMVRRLFRQQWDALALLNPGVIPVYAEALAEFAAEHLAQEPWPWSSRDDDPVRRLALAALPLPPSRVRPMLQTMVMRLVNHPLMDNQVMSVSTWETPQLAPMVRDLLLALLCRSSCGWDQERQHHAIEVLQPRSLAPSSTPESPVVPAQWTVVDSPDDLDGTHPWRTDPSSSSDSVDQPEAHLWWTRVLRWWGAAPRPTARTTGESRGEALVWNALKRLTASDAPRFWVPVSLAVANACVRWPEHEARTTLQALVDGLAAIPGLWPAEPTGWNGQRWSMTARHTFLTALDASPGWTDKHRRMVVEALDPALATTGLYTFDGLGVVRTTAQTV